MCIRDSLGVVLGDTREEVDILGGVQPLEREVGQSPQVKALSLIHISEPTRPY